MTARDDFDRSLAAWLAADAPSVEPEHLLGQVLARTARTRRRPAWRILERWIDVSILTSRVATPGGVPWRTAALVAILVVALAAGLVLAVGALQRRAVPAPFGPAANGKLVYSVDGDIVAADGPNGTARTIVGGPTADDSAWFSPDGTRFTFVRGGAELWVANSDGTDPRKLADVAQLSGVEWSPQGDQIAVTSESGMAAITMVRADGSGSAVIDTGLAAAVAPVFRPADGSQIVFRGKDVHGDWGLYLMDRSGAHLARLDLDKGFLEDPSYADNVDAYFDDPAWSPDGRTLYYHTPEAVPSSPTGTGLRIHIAQIDASGVVTSDRIRDFDPQDEDEYGATPLPSGAGIVFQAVRGPEHQLWLGSADAAVPPRDLGVKADHWFFFQVSPDGNDVIMAVPPTDTSEAIVRTIDLKTGVITPSSLPIGFTWQRLAK